MNAYDLIRIAVLQIAFFTIRIQPISTLPISLGNYTKRLGAETASELTEPNTSTVPTDKPVIVEDNKIITDKPVILEDDKIITDRPTSPTSTLDKLDSPTVFDTSSSKISTELLKNIYTISDTEPTGKSTAEPFIIIASDATHIQNSSESRNSLFEKLNLFDKLEINPSKSSNAETTTATTIDTTEVKKADPIPEKTDVVNEKVTDGLVTSSTEPSTSTSAQMSHNSTETTQNTNTPFVTTSVLTDRILTVEVVSTSYEQTSSFTTTEVPKNTKEEVTTQAIVSKYTKETEISSTDVLQIDNKLNTIPQVDDNIIFSTTSTESSAKNTTTTEKVGTLNTVSKITTTEILEPEQFTGLQSQNFLVSALNMNANNVSTYITANESSSKDLIAEVLNVTGELEKLENNTSESSSSSSEEILNASIVYNTTEKSSNNALLEKYTEPVTEAESPVTSPDQPKTLKNLQTNEVDKKPTTYLPVRKEYTAIERKRPSSSTETVSPAHQSFDPKASTKRMNVWVADLQVSNDDNMELTSIPRNPSSTMYPTMTHPTTTATSVVSRRAGYINNSDLPVTVRDVEKLPSSTNPARASNPILTNIPIQAPVLDISTTDSRYVTPFFGQSSVTTPVTPTKPVTDPKVPTITTTPKLNDTIPNAEFNITSQVIQRNLSEELPVYVETDALPLSPAQSQQMRLVDDALKEEFMKEMSLNIKKNLADGDKSSEDSSDEDDTITSSASTANVTEKARNLSLYKVNPNYKPLKRLEIQPSKQFTIDPDDNSWRNESINSRGIVFKAKNSSIVFTQVLKNKTESELNNTKLNKDNKDELPDLRERLERIAEKRKLKKKYNNTSVAPEEVEHLLMAPKKEKNEGLVLEEVDSVPVVIPPQVEKSQGAILEDIDNVAVNAPRQGENSHGIVNSEIEKMQVVAPPRKSKSRSRNKMTTTELVPFKKTDDVYDSHEDEEEDDYHLTKVTHRDILKQPVPISTLFPPSRKGTIEYFPPRNFGKQVKYKVDFFATESGARNSDEDTKIRKLHIEPEFSRERKPHPLEPQVKGGLPTRADELSHGVYVIKHYRDFLRQAANDQPDERRVEHATPKADLLGRLVEEVPLQPELPLVYNASVEHGGGSASRAWLRRLADSARPGSYLAHTKPYDESCENLTVELNPAYELHYYVPDQEERQEPAMPDRQDVFHM